MPGSENNAASKDAPEIVGDIAVTKLIELLDENEVAARKDREYLLKLLKARNFDINEVLHQMKDREEHVRQNDRLNLKKSQIKTVLDSNVLTFTKEFDKDNCRVLWLRCGLWEPEQVEPELLMQVADLLINLIIYESSAEEIGNGLKLIFDSDQIGMNQLYGCSPSVALNMHHVLVNCMLLPIDSIHNFNEVWISTLVYGIFQVFLSEENKSYLKFHGTDIPSIQKAIGVLALPTELGGISEIVKGSHWLELLDNNDIRKELSLSGYTITED